MEHPQFRSIQGFALGKLGQAERRSDPFPFLVVPKLLPRGLAAALEQAWPMDQMEAMPEYRTGNPYAHRARRLFRLNGESVLRLPERSRRLWGLFHQLMVTLTPSLMGALPVPPPTQKSAETDGVSLYPRVDLWADYTGYQVPPHTEAPHKFANFLFYLSSDPSHSGEGTSIYVPRDPHLRSWEGRQMHRNLFKRTATVPYRSNLLFGFRKTDLSFHGKEPITLQSEKPRLAVGISIQARENFVD